jgi:2-amino-4-hydroxy-6-hydroxymethyldihydropteridine diphosphokinase
MQKIAIALGGNLGDVEKSFDFAKSMLKRHGMVIDAVSSSYRTVPVDCAPGTPDFINAVLIGKWNKSPESLLRLCQQIEQTSGRPATHGINQPRTLDMDIILFGDGIINSPELTIPHPRAHERNFVLQPLAEIAPEWVFPDSGKTVKQLLEKL